MAIARFLTLGLALCAAAPLMAQAPDLESAFKVRFGLQAGSVNDGLTNRLMGFGLEVATPAFGGAVFGELGYQFKPGTQYRRDLSGMARTAGTTLNPAQSVESVKNSVQGAYLRLGYEGALSEALAWRAGLQLGGSSFRHEYVGQVTDGTEGGAAPKNATYQDTYFGTPSKSAIAFSPFAGLSYRINAMSKVEFGVLLMGYKALDYRHVAGTEKNTAPGYVWYGHTRQDSLAETNRYAPHVEVAYAFRF